MSELEMNIIKSYLEENWVDFDMHCREWDLDADQVFDEVFEE